MFFCCEYSIFNGKFLRRIPESFINLTIFRLQVLQQVQITITITVQCSAVIKEMN